MPDWIVIVSSPGQLRRRRVIVLDIPTREDAERLAYLKLGVTPNGHDAFVDLADETVSIENPTNRLEELQKQYDKALEDLADSRRAHAIALDGSFHYSKKAEEVETERDQQIELNRTVSERLIVVKTLFDEMLTDLERKKKRAKNQRRS